MDVLISAKSACIAIGDYVVIDVFDISVNRGDYILITGPNGAGKTTLLRHLSGGIPNSHIQIYGTCSSLIKISSFSLQKLTVRDNIRMYRQINDLLEVPQDDFVQRALEVAMFDSSILGKRFSHLSDGSKMRINFALAYLLSLSRDYMVMDEWLSVGDAAFRKSTENLFFDLLKDKQKSLILATNSKPPSFFDPSFVVELI